MLVQGYEIEITKDAVDAKQDDSTTPKGKSRFLAVLLIALSIFDFCMFTMGEGRSNLWSDLSYRHWHTGLSGDTIFLALIAIAVPGFLFLLGARLLFPVGTALHCDRYTFTVSKIPWINFQGKWVSESFPLSEVSQLSFAVVASGRGGDVYGIRFFTNGKKNKIFAGIQPPEASHILNGLASLGADVVHDPEMLTKIQATVRERHMQLDRSK